MIDKEQSKLAVTLIADEQPDNDNHILSDYIPRHVLQEIQDSLSEVLQAPIIFASWDGKPITRTPHLSTFCYRFIWKADERRPCAHCHRFQEIDAHILQKDSIQKYEQNDCFLGLSDIVIPIILGQRITGFLLTSQIINNNEDRVNTEKQIIETGINKEKATSFLDSLPTLNDQYIAQVSNSIMSMVRMISGLAYSYASNTRFAIRDSLTGLLNRAYMWDYLESRVAEGNIPRKPFAIVNIDLNDFKLINDTFGHHAGDRVLLGVAKVLDESIRPADVAVRYGGDEFAIILDSVCYDEASLISKRIMNKIADLNIIYNHHMLNITACCGISTYSGTTNADVECLFIDSDNELYKAKAEHKGKRVL
ncbi:MAG: diguanylate cyclase [Armatimonadota bacterium]